MSPTHANSRTDTQHRDNPAGKRPPMRVETLVFAGGILFFLPVALIYGFWTGWEPVGTVTLLLLAGLYALVSGYLWVVSRRIDPRPEDDPLGEIEQRAGEIGVFAPHSWGPFITGLATAGLFLGLVVGWWLFGVFAVLAVIGVIYQLFEFSRGQHAH